MIAGINIAEIAALIGDQARANILTALMDGRARTATELAYAAGVSPQTTSGHLAKLTEGKLLALEIQGRHRYYRLSNPTVGEALEALMVVASGGAKRHRPTGPHDAALKEARTCYDHLAGRLGVAIADALEGQGAVRREDGDFIVTESGRALLTDFGLDLDALAAKRRAFCRVCLDWSERRPHLGGSLAAALADRCRELGWTTSGKAPRSVVLTPAGKRGLAERFGIDLTETRAA